MAKRRRSRLYFREGRGFYMDLRSLGGGLRACIPDGQSFATHDPDEAARILTGALAELQSHDGDAADPLLRVYSKRHLRLKNTSRRSSTVVRDELALRTVLEWLGADTRLSDITVSRLSDYVVHRQSQPGKKDGTTISAQTILHELHAISSLFKRGIAEGVVQSNPVSQLPDRPRVSRSESVWLENDEAARLIRAGFEMDERPHRRAVPYLGPIFSTFLLTGGRAGEVFGLMVEDIDTENGVVHLRANAYRRLKRETHRRTVPLWPQLAKTLEPYMAAHDRRPGDLLFPSRRGGMMGDLRKSRDSALTKAGIKSKHVTWHTLRHTYAATRLQTLDHGGPVSPYTVMRELGHRSLKLIEDVYGHLQGTRHRAPVVEYRETKVLEFPGVAKGA